MFKTGENGRWAEKRRDGRVDPQAVAAGNLADPQAVVTGEGRPDRSPPGAGQVHERETSQVRPSSRRAGFFASRIFSDIPVALLTDHAAGRTGYVSCRP